VTLRPAESAVCLTVEDQGPGLPPGDPEQVFERFFRGETNRRPGETGAGLGLAIVAAVVTAHGGSVSAAPRPGGGARFDIVLPLARDLPPSDDDPDEIGEGRPAAAATDEGAR
jgi:signal transduction histidine kinase